MLPEIIFASNDPVHSKSIQRELRARRLKKLCPKVYTSDLITPPETLVSRNLYPILAKLYPGALLSHRSALEGRPVAQTVFLTYRYTKKVNLPGVVVRLLQGPGPTKLDLPFVGGLYICCEARALLENLQPSRQRTTIPKTLARKVLEERLASILDVRGEAGLNKLRDDARQLAGELGLTRELPLLEGLISALLRTGPTGALASPRALARAAGRPYDPARLELFTALYASLRGEPLPSLVEARLSASEIAHNAFFEAYFSNFIEGTEFELEEARAIVMDQAIPTHRPADAHDILGTFAIVSNEQEMRRVPSSADDLLELLCSRHATLMSARPDRRPGLFKEAPNRAGSTHFVAPALVRGTLERAFEIYQALEQPLERAIFIMFAVAEVHPFDDGNGRVARIMMNAELIREGLVRVLIPTVYREDYLLALRALSRSGGATACIKMICQAQRFAATLELSSFEVARAMLETANAFSLPHEATLIIPS